MNLFLSEMNPNSKRRRKEGKPGLDPSAYFPRPYQVKPHLYHTLPDSRGKGGLCQ